MRLFKTSREARRYRKKQMKLFKLKRKLSSTRPRVGAAVLVRHPDSVEKAYVLRHHQTTVTFTALCWESGREVVLFYTSEGKRWVRGWGPASEQLLNAILAAEALRA